VSIHDIKVIIKAKGGRLGGLKRSFTQIKYLGICKETIMRTNKKDE